MIRYRFTFIVIFLITITDWASVSVFGPLIIEITQSLSVTIGMMGMIHSLFLILSGILSFLWAFLENRYTRKKLFMIAVSLYSLGLFLTCISLNIITFFFSRILSAVGFGALLPLSNSIIIDLRPSEKRTNSFALLGMAMFLGSGTGIMLSGLLLGLFSWRVLIFLLSLVSMITTFFLIPISIPKRGITEKSLTIVLSQDEVQYTHRLGLVEMRQFTKTKTNIHFMLMFFIHDFVMGTVSFYFITLLRVDVGFTPFTAMITQILIFIPQLFGVSLWGKKADKEFRKRANGKVIILLFTIILGSGFSITAYALGPTHVTLFIMCLMVFSYMTSSTPSIAYSILGDINPPEVRSTAFSLGNLSGLVGRSVGIALCGFLYQSVFNTYHHIFLIWQIIFVVGIILVLISPLNQISLDLRNLTRLLEQRVKDLVDQKKIVEREKSEDPLEMILKNQMVLANRQKELAKNQYYLTKMLYYSLEVIRRILKSVNFVNGEDEENNHELHLTEVVDKIENYIRNGSM